MLIYPEGARGRGDVAHTRLGLAYLAMAARQPWPGRRDLVAPVAEELRVRLAEHVARAVELTGHPQPGPAPDEVVDAPGRRGPEVGSAMQEESR